MFKSIIIAAIATATVVSTMGAFASATGTNSSQNHENYWGENCTKYEVSGEQQVWHTMRSEVMKVIVKGGTGRVVYEDGNFDSLKAPVNDKNGKNYGISHVIECYGTAEVSTPDVCAYDAALTAEDEACSAPEMCEYNADITADNHACVAPEAPAACEYNDAILATDDSCVAAPAEIVEEPVVSADPVDPVAEQTPEAPEVDAPAVLSTDTEAGKGVAEQTTPAVLPTELPNTGASPALALVGSLIIGAASYVASIRRQMV